MNYENYDKIQRVRFGEIICSIYLPKNISSDTEVFCFTHGGAANDRNNWAIVESYLNENKSNNIVIMPSISGNFDPEWSSKIIDIIEQIQEHYGLKSKNVASSDFNFGGWSTYQITIENIKRNPDIGPQILFLTDDYNPSASHIANNVLTNEEKEILLKNNSILFLYQQWEPLYQSSNKSHSNQRYAADGLNIIKVICNYRGHQEIKSNFFKNRIIDYTTSTITLPKEGYTYQKYDKNTGNWSDIDVTSISTIDKLYSFFGIETRNIYSFENKLSKLSSLNIFSLDQLAVTSDSKTLVNNVNNVISKIKSTNFIQNKPSFSIDYSSTTKVPAEINRVVSDFFQSNAELLLKLSNDMNSIIQIGATFDELNKQLEGNIPDPGIIEDRTSNQLNESFQNIFETTNDN